MMQKFNIIFFSEVNSKFGMPIFKKLYNDKRFSIKAFVTTPKGKLCSYYVNEKDPVDLEEFARSKDIPVFQPNNINTSEFVGKLSAFNPDYILIANYQKILKENLINLPKFKTLNFHPSPLPRYAGLSPFFWMSLNGERNTGVSCIEVTPEIDGGDIVMQKKVELTGNENSLEVRKKLFKASFVLFDDVLDLISQGPVKAYKQDKSKRDYHSNPSKADKTITEYDTVKTALAKLKACAPGNAYVQVDNRIIEVNSISWDSVAKTKVKLKDGNLSFFMESRS